MPASFVKSVIFSLHKKRDPKILENYRGLSFSDCIAKLFSGILFERLIDRVENKKILGEFQAGFRGGYSTIDRIFTLIDIVYLRWNRTTTNKKVFAFFVDFKSAFDSVSRRSLFYKLYYLSISTKIHKILKELFTDTVPSVWAQEGLTEEFEVQSGVKRLSKYSQAV